MIIEKKNLITEWASELNIFLIIWLFGLPVLEHSDHGIMGRGKPPSWGAYAHAHSYANIIGYKMCLAKGFFLLLCDLYAKNG